jgi:predicted phosphodiesterase
MTTAKQSHPELYEAIKDITKKSRLRIGRIRIAQLLEPDFGHVSKTAITKILAIIREEEKETGRVEEKVSVGRLEKDVIKFIHHEKRSLHDICNFLDKSPKTVLEVVERIKNKGYLVNLSEDGHSNITITDSPESGGSSVIDLSRFTNKPVKIGFIADTHLCSRYCRLDVCETLYDIFSEEGITDVYHGGNYVDGESKLNQFDILAHGIEGQLDYFAENYPQREGITTHFVAGDDHEGWWTQREGIDIGRRTEETAVAKGRHDLHYLSYMENDVELKSKNGSSVMRVAHAGGGSAPYAISYRSQKIVESLQSGEKPNILLLGHYHKFDCVYARGVWVVQMGSTQEQTPFMRKKSLESQIGGGIIHLVQADDGSISRFKVEFIPFYDRGFYKNDFKRF